MLMRAIKAAGKSVLAVSVAALLGACGGDTVVPSSSTPTSQMRATIEIYSDRADSANASVQLRTVSSMDSSNDEYIELLDEDGLWFTTGANLREQELGSDWFESLSGLAQTQRLLSTTIRYRSGPIFFLFWSNMVPEQVHYNATLNNVPDGASYTVSLLRRSRSTDALESTVTMPQAFDLLSPSSNHTLSRSSDPVQVEWSISEENTTVEVDVTTTCVNEREYRYQTSVDQDTGTIQLDAGEIDSDSVSGSCSTTLTLARVRLGQLDSAYGGGSISARQVRTATFTTAD